MESNNTTTNSNEIDSSYSKESTQVPSIPSENADEGTVKPVRGIRLILLVMGLFFGLSSVFMDEVFYAAYRQLYDQLITPILDYCCRCHALNHRYLSWSR